MGNLSAYTIHLIKYALIACFILLLSIIGIKPVSAVGYSVTFENSSPSGYSACTAPAGCINIETCWNSWAPGQTDCGQACVIGGVARGSAWTRYDYSGCVETEEDPATGQSLECTSWYSNVGAVCSTADKCTSTSNNPYLNAGRCDCTVLGQYKTCCSNTTPSLVSDNSCVQLSVDTTNPPYEGVCPAGSSSVFCGFGSNPPCGQSACGVLPPPPCTPDGSCDALTPSCGQTTAGVDNCGNPCSKTGPACTSSCSVSWTLSSTNPPPDSTVNVSVNGSTTPNWTGASYSLDAGSWTAAGSGPPFNFSVNSDSADLPHTLRFAINNGSTVCGSSGVNSFSTQAATIKM